MTRPISRTTEIRHVSQLAKSQLGEILDRINSWKTLMAIIPSTLNDPETIDESEDAPLKYSTDDIKYKCFSKLIQFYCTTKVSMLYIL